MRRLRGLRRDPRGNDPRRLEIDAASNRGINEVRDLRDRINYAPTDLRRKVYILDEAHQITKDAWNALLKSLEEPPDFVVVHVRLDPPAGVPAGDPVATPALRRPTADVAEIEGKLARIIEADGRSAEPAAVHLIARLAAGGMRDAESMLDQLLSPRRGDRIDEAAVRDLLGLADADAVDGFVDALLDRRRRRPASGSSTASRSAAATPRSSSTRWSTPSARG